LGTLEVDTREVWKKGMARGGALRVRRAADAGRVGYGDPSHCFNYNRDGHF
jgi:hypothetical protein